MKKKISNNTNKTFYVAEFKSETFGEPLLLGVGRDVGKIHRNKKHTQKADSMR